MGEQDIIDGLIQRVNNEAREWQNRHMGDWKHDPKLEQAVRLWREYYDVCEDYDRRVCSGRRKGVAVPLDQRESRLINSHALDADRQLREKLHAAGIDRDTSASAKDIALREHEREYGK